MIATMSFLVVKCDKCGALDECCGHELVFPSVAEAIRQRRIGADGAWVCSTCEFAKEETPKQETPV